ncbi:MAG: DUF2231 domain-containing protein [Pyrinomonadaceae bacterium]
MPPVHPAIVHFPIALVTLSVLADLFGYIFNSDSLRGAGWWSLLGAAIGGALAVVAGLYDMNREKIEHEAHERVHVHMKVGFVVLAVVAVLTLWRWWIYANNANAVSIVYLVVAFLVLGLTMFQGYLGDELVFADGAGVAPTGQGTEPPKQARERAAKVAGGLR